MNKLVFENRIDVGRLIGVEYVIQDEDHLVEQGALCFLPFDRLDNMAESRGDLRLINRVKVLIENLRKVFHFSNKLISALSTCLLKLSPVLSEELRLR